MHAGVPTVQACTVRVAPRLQYVTASFGSFRLKVSSVSGEYGLEHVGRGRLLRLVVAVAATDRQPRSQAIHLSE